MNAFGDFTDGKKRYCCFNYAAFISPVLPDNAMRLFRATG